MPDVDTQPRITLKMSTPFAKKGGAQIWSVKFSLHGGNIPSEAEAETVALGLWQPIQQLTSANTSLIGWLYYDEGTNVNTYQAVYGIGVHPGNSDGYPTIDYPQQLEVVILARAPVGVNSKGRAKYLMKHIHDVQAEEGSESGVTPTLTAIATLFHNWNVGVGTAPWLPCDPSTGEVPTEPWNVDPALFTRQMRI